MSVSRLIGESVTVDIVATTGLSVVSSVRLADLNDGGSQGRDASYAVRQRDIHGDGLTQSATVAVEITAPTPEPDRST